jgi:prepilin-type N-terminal cleavage/methylation domain-containing protein/prepilin-type processing-associated H-X9-DG protein
MIGRTGRLHVARLRSFTLVELLVVIAIIGILVSLLLPAIQAARESARRTQCQNKFKQVGLAFQNYHSSQKTFPHGCKLRGPDCTYGDNYQGFSWGALILPYLEEGSMNDLIDYSRQWYELPNSSLEVGGAVINVYLCPSAQNSDLRGTAASSINRPGHDPRDDLGKTNMAGVHDSVEYLCEPGCLSSCTPTSDGDGVLMNHVPIAMRRIVDGTSHTLLVGEITNGFSGDYNTAHWMTHDTLDTADGINGIFTIPGGARLWNYYRNGFSSYHPGGCHFSMCDGSVQFLSENTDATLLADLTTRDGERTTGTTGPPPR